MEFSLTLSVSGVHFELKPSHPGSASSSPIVSVSTKQNSCRDDDKFQDEVSDVVADLSNFSGTLRVSRALVQSEAETPNEQFSKIEHGSTGNLSERNSAPSHEPPGLESLSLPQSSNDLLTQLPLDDTNSHCSSILPPHDEFGNDGQDTLTLGVPEVAALRKFDGTASNERSTDGTVDENSEALQGTVQTGNSAPDEDTSCNDAEGTEMKNKVHEMQRSVLSPSADHITSVADDVDDLFLDSYNESSSMTNVHLAQMSSSKRDLPPERAVRDTPNETDGRAKSHLKNFLRKHNFLGPFSKQNIMEEEEKEEIEFHSTTRRDAAFKVSETNDATAPSTSIVGSMSPSRDSAITASSHTTTPLHQACANANTNMNELRSLLVSSPESVRIPDMYGRLPLHVFAQNEALALAHSRDESKLFVQELFESHPGSMVTKDKEGRVPFIGPIIDWIDEIHSHSSHSTHVSSSRRIFQATRELLQSDLQYFEGIDGFDESRMFLFPRDVSVTPYVEWAINMLSFIVDRLNPLTNARALQTDAFGYRRSFIIKQFASIPFIAKTIFLIDDDDERKRVTNTSIFRCSVLCPTIIGSWMVAMLRAKPHSRSNVQSRVLDFFEFISSISGREYHCCNRRCTQEELNTFRKRREETFKAVARVRGIVSSLLLLDSAQTERAASTVVVKYVLDESIRRPIALLFMLLHLSLHMILMIAYRVHLQVFDLNLEADVSMPFYYEAPWLLVVIIGSYFLLQDVMTLASMMALSMDHSRQIFLSHCKDFWNLIDVVSISFAISTAVFLRFRPDSSVAIWLAITTGLLWVKLLGFLKAINMELATFILAVIEIMKAMRWFLLVVFITIVMFADMVEIISKATPGVCPTGVEQDSRRLDAQEDFCSPSVFDSYVRIYAIFVGDVSLDDYQSTTSITILFVLFTLFGVIALLNVLIAIVNDTYILSKTRSHGLFGRARVVFVSHQLARERLLRGPQTSDGTDYVGQIVHNARCWKFIWVTSLLAHFAGIVAVETMLVFFFKLLQEENLEDHLLFYYVWMVICSVLFNLALLTMALMLSNRAWGTTTLAESLAWVVKLPINLYCRLVGVGDNAVVQDDDGFVGGEWKGLFRQVEERTAYLFKSLEDKLKVDAKASEQRLAKEEELTRSVLQHDIKMLTTVVKEHWQGNIPRAPS